MKKTILFATALMMASCSIPYDSYDRAIVICPRSEEQFVTLMSADTTDYINTAFVSLKGYTQDTLYMSFAEGCFWNLKLIGNIDTTFRNDWYEETLPVSYHTRTTTDGDSVVIRYWIN